MPDLPLLIKKAESDLISAKGVRLAMLCLFAMMLVIFAIIFVVSQFTKGVNTSGSAASVLLPLGVFLPAFWMMIQSANGQVSTHTHYLGILRELSGTLLPEKSGNASSFLARNP